MSKESNMANPFMGLIALSIFVLGIAIFEYNPYPSIPEGAPDSLYTITNPFILVRLLAIFTMSCGALMLFSSIFKRDH